MNTKTQAPPPVRKLDGAEFYYVRNAEDHTWGYFLLHPNGIMMAYTDYGTYAYHWSAQTMESLKRFLVQLRNMDYLLGKVCRRDELNGEKTRKAFVQHILDWRRQGTFTKERARELYDELRDTEDQDIVRWGYEQGDDFPDCWEWAVYEFPASAHGFVKHLWPLFIEQLKAEISPKEV